MIQSYDCFHNIAESFYVLLETLLFSIRYKVKLTPGTARRGKGKKSNLRLSEVKDSVCTVYTETLILFIKIAIKTFTGLKC